MLTCKTFGNVYADVILREEFSSSCVLLSLVGSESTVRGASAAFLEDHTLYFGEDARFGVRRSLRFDTYRLKTRRLSQNIIHSLIYPLDFSSHIVVGRDESEIKERLTRKVMEEIPFLPEWADWLWKWSIDTHSFEPLETITGGIIGGWVRIDYEELKSAISDNIENLRERIS